MQIAIFAFNPRDVFSGGRYHSFILAECLAHRDHEVYYVTNNKPLFYDYFNEYKNHERINLILTKNFKKNLPKGNFDYVVLVPHQNPSDFFYSETKKFARISNAKLVLLNFESANWFNKYSPRKRDEKYWHQWVKCCKQGCLVLSSARESLKYAREFYTHYPDRTYFDYWYPPINSLQADKIPDLKKENRIVTITRMSDQHKGAGDILKLIHKKLKGYTLVFLLGGKTVDDYYMHELGKVCKKYKVKFEFKLQLSDLEKFEEIKRAKLMLFPSYFEGFGYPPIEAQYCGTPCIAYDLPVLRETSKNGLHYVSTGNIGEFKAKIKEVLSNKNYDYNSLRKNILPVADFKRRAEEAEKVFLKYLDKEFYRMKEPEKVINWFYRIKAFFKK